ncbi:transposase [Enterococcus canintestini]
MAMKGVGPSLRAQLMTEIGDIRYFSHRSALTAFVGIALAPTVKKSV